MRRKKRQPILAGLRQGLTLPAAELYLGSSIHINDKGAVQLENCKAVTAYEENAVEIKLENCKVRLSGDRLTLVSLSTGVVAVEGKLFRIDFFY